MNDGDAKLATPSLHLGGTPTHFALPHGAVTRSNTKMGHDPIGDTPDSRH